MKEDLVRAVMVAYFRQMNIDAQSTGKREAGPDFHIDGLAVEVKGQGLDYGRLFQQLVIYAFRYREVQLAMPLDAVTADGLFRLYLLEGIIRELRSKSLKLYLVSDADDTFYHVKEFGSVIQLFLTEMNRFHALAESVRNGVKLSEALGTVSEPRLREVAKVASETVSDSNYAIGRVLGEIMNRFPYVMVAKSTVKT